MANFPIETGQGDEAYLKATGTGTSGDPYIVEHEATQATHDDLNGNANLQVGNADVGAANPVPVSFGSGISLPAGTNNIGDVDIAGALPAGTNNIGDVDVLSVAAGENHIGQVSGHAAILEVTLSLDTNIYADGDVLADTQEIASALRVSDGLARLRSLVVIDQDDQGVDMDIYLLDGNVSFGTENNAVSIADADALKILARVVIAAADYYDLGGVRVAVKSGLDAILKAASGTDKLYVAAVSRGTGTYTASGVKLRIGIERL